MASLAPPPLSCHHHNLGIHKRTTWTWNNTTHFPSFTTPKSSLLSPSFSTHDKTEWQKKGPYLQRLNNLCDSGNLNEALNLLQSQFHDAVFSSDLRADDTIGLLLQACGRHKDIDVGRRVHALVSASSQLRNDVVLNTRILTMYSMCGSPADSRSVFNAMPKKNLFLWNALLSGALGRGTWGSGSRVSVEDGSFL
ncbi:Tetratricopeptide-like helical domain superfamily [Sesbania bispinosa]|nr:Tetratricopeptide-like helical domain superfamily [Sesbania bispinosa]